MENIANLLLANECEMDTWEVSKGKVAVLCGRLLTSASRDRGACDAIAVTSLSTLARSTFATHCIPPGPAGCSPEHTVGYISFTVTVHQNLDNIFNNHTFYS